MRTTLFFILFMVSGCLGAPKTNEIFILQPEPIKQFDNILYTFKMVESSNREKVVNPSGATGILQIMPIMIKEVNRICKKLKNPMRFTLADRFDLPKSVQIWYIVQNYYNAGYDLKKACKVWNSRGGEKYLNAIKKYMNL